MLLRSIATMSVVVIAGTTLAGCGAKRSTEALCESVTTHRSLYDSQQSAEKELGLSGYLTIAASLENIKTMWSDFAKVAPDEIKDDVKDVSDAWDSMKEDTLSEDWAKTYAAELNNAAAEDNVDNFIASNCK